MTDTIMKVDIIEFTDSDGTVCDIPIDDFTWGPGQSWSAPLVRSDGVKVIRAKRYTLEQIAAELGWQR